MPIKSVCVIDIVLHGQLFIAMITLSREGSTKGVEAVFFFCEKKKTGTWRKYKKRKKKRKKKKKKKSNAHRIGGYKHGDLQPNVPLKSNDSSMSQQ